MIPVKLIAGLLALIGVIGLAGWGIVADFDAGKRAGGDAVQKLWDQDKAKIQQLTDAAIATATKQRDEALAANEAIQNDYQRKLNLASADAAQFASRLRAAEARLTAANSGTVPKGGAGSEPTGAGQAGSADQLGQLVTLVTDLRTECKANDDELDALVAQLNRQL